MRAILGTSRYWMGLVLGFALVRVAAALPPLLAYAMLIVAALLIFDACTALLASASRSGGGMHDHRQ